MLPAALAVRNLIAHLCPCCALGAFMWEYGRCSCFAGQQKHLNPFVVWFGAMNVQPGLHTVQATINFNDPDYAPFTTWG